MNQDRVQAAGGKRSQRRARTVGRWIAVQFDEEKRAFGKDRVKEWREELDKLTRVLTNAHGVRLGQKKNETSQKVLH